MATERPVALFKCKQNELIAVAYIAVRSYMESQPDLALHKGKYTAAWGANFKAQIDAAKNMRNFQARNARAEGLKIDLDAKNREICDKWQGLKLHIADVPGWEKKQKAKLEEAGWLNYEAALKGGWAATTELTAMANTFMSDYSADLVTPDNMPAAFPGQFANMATEFSDLLEEFEDANQDSDVDTDARLIKYNELYTVLMSMFADGAYVYKKNASMRNRFIFSTVLELIRGSSTPIKTFAVDANSLKQVDRVVANSKVTNTGSTVLWVEKGTVSEKGPGAVELMPETDMPTPGVEITVFNEEAVAGEFEARVVVD